MTSNQPEPVIVGRGPFRYRALPRWERLPQGYDFGEVAGVATDWMASGAPAPWNTAAFICVVSAVSREINSPLLARSK